MRGWGVTHQDSISLCDNRRNAYSDKPAEPARVFFTLVHKAARLGTGARCGCADGVIVLQVTEEPLSFVCHGGL